MRRAVVYGLIVAGVCLLFALGGGSEAQKVTADVGRVMNVSGSVAITNLPSVQTFVGITQATFADDMDGVYVLTLNRACAAEFPGTRLCQLHEVLLDTVPAPPAWPGLVRITGMEPNALAGREGTLGFPSACLRSTGAIGHCSYSMEGAGPWPAACCGH